MTNEVAAIWYDIRFWRDVVDRGFTRGRNLRIYKDDETLLLKAERISSEETQENRAGEYEKINWWRFWIDDYFCVYTVIEYKFKRGESYESRVKSSYRSLYGSTTMDEVEHILALVLLQKETVDGE